MTPFAPAVTAGLELSVEPSPPVLPLAQTVTTPRRASAACARKMSRLSAPHEQLTTRIGGHTFRDAPRPHGEAWWRRIQANAFVVPRSVVVVEMKTRRAPGAEPPTRVPSGSRNWFPTATPPT